MNALVKESLGIGGGAAVLGSAFAYLKSIPRFIWTKTRNMTTVNIDIIANVNNTEDSELIRWLESWLGDYKEKIHRNFKAASEWLDAISGYTGVLTKDVEYNPGWFKYKGKRMLIRCHKREAGQNGAIFYDYYVTFFTRNHKIAQEFLDDIRLDYKSKQDNRIFSRLYKDGEWKKAKAINERPFESVILPEGDALALKDDIDKFISRKQLYKDLNITHKRGYLFEGIPGSGKSSIANAIACYLRWTLYTFNKTDIKKGTLSSAFSDIKSQSVILLEDIDTYNITRNQEKENEQEDTGDWLNWLDGINSPDDCIFVLTTNFVEKLDPALIRDGRVDFSMHFGYATEYQMREAFKRFHLSASEEQIEDFIARHKDKPVVMADIQNDLFKLYVPEWRGLEAPKEDVYVSGTRRP
jgi:mitochondrial chaperone BCS1